MAATLQQHPSSTTPKKLQTAPKHHFYTVSTYKVMPNIAQCPPSTWEEGSRIRDVLDLLGLQVIETPCTVLWRLHFQWEQSTEPQGDTSTPLESISFISSTASHSTALSV